MNANRENPFRSPPSSTGSHGTVSPTMSTIAMSDVDGDTTRKLNEDIARLTAPSKFNVNWEAANRKWPEFQGAASTRAGAKENLAPASAARDFDDDTQDSTWRGSARTRAEMQPRVDETEASSIMGRSPGLFAHDRKSSAMGRDSRTSAPAQRPTKSAHSDALAAMIKSQNDAAARNASRRSMSVNAASMLAHTSRVPPSPAMSSNHGHNISKSFIMPDITHLGDFVSGNLKLTGAAQNGVPVFVKHGRVHDRASRQASNNYAEIDGMEIPVDEEKIFVSMDMIRKEIITLQEHDDMVQKYADGLQKQVDRLETEVRRSRTTRSGSHDSGLGSSTSDNAAHERLVAEKTSKYPSCLPRAILVLTRQELKTSSSLSEHD